jgi:chemotaxis protein MotB
VQIAGFADTRPLDSNDTANGRAQNRRIEVIVDDN